MFEKAPELVFDGACLQGRPNNVDACLAPRDLETRSDDVFLVSYPRTGTNWVENILVGLRYGPEALDEAGLSQIMQLFPCLELLNTMETAEKLQSPRFMMTHLHMFSAPREIFLRKRKIVLLLRNPKAAAASFVKYYRNAPANAEFGVDGVDEFLNKYLTGDVFYGCWWDWTKRWLDFARKNPETVFVIHYEELLGNFMDIASRLSEFIGAPIKEIEELMMLEARCSVGNMKSRYRKESAHMVHSGKGSSWNKEISVDFEERFDMKTRETFPVDLVEKFI